MGLSPAPQFPERPGWAYERKWGPNTPGGRGPLRFEEGIPTDTDVPDDFGRGMVEAAIPAPGRPNHVNPNVLFKHADETMRERAHVGSAAWVDAPTVLNEFAHGTFADFAEQRYEAVWRSGTHQDRRTPTVVED
jgi:hypothetical protein